MESSMEDIEETFVRVNQAETSVLKLGSLNDASPGPNGKKTIFLIVPGNPGVPDFYKDFMRKLYNLSSGRVPVWTIGQAGHVKPPSQSLSLSDVYSTNDEIYGLKAQILHKATFIKEQVPEDVSVIMIGHSIGCYMILNALEYLPSSRVPHCFLLFPTVERMAISPNGKTMTPVFRYLRWLLVLISFFLSIFPESIRKSIIKFHFRNSDSPPCFHDGVGRTISPWTVNLSTYLAKHEMQDVDVLQKHLVQKYSQKLSFYYGACDDWTPKQYFYDLKASFPEADARLCEHNYKHAYIEEIREGRAMAEIVWSWGILHQVVQ